VSEKGHRQVLWRDVYLQPMLARIARGPVLSRCEFIGCTIIGPAVVVVMDCEFEDCTTRDPVDRIWWPAPSLADGQAVPPGAVGLRHCTFRNCTFEHVGFVAAGDRPVLTPADQDAPRGASPTAGHDREPAQ
jgi:hypothetical protein